MILPVALLFAAAYPQPPQPSSVVSPEVHPDRTVTFRIRAPKAERGGEMNETGVHTDDEFRAREQPRGRGLERLVVAPQRVGEPAEPLDEPRVVLALEQGDQVEAHPPAAQRFKRRGSEMKN